MTIPYQTMYGYAVGNAALSNRMTCAVAIAAQAVFGEDAGTANHAARLAWAQKAIADPEAMGRKMVWGVLGDPAIQAAGAGATDAQIQASVDALVDQFLLA